MRTPRVFLIAARYFLTMLLMAAICGQSTTKQKPLTEEQIRELIRVGAPDRLVAKQIQDRGVSFRVTSALIRELKNNGAGAMTCEELSRHRVPASLILRTDPPMPNVTIQIGERTWETGEQGEVAIEDLDAGEIELEAKHLLLTPQRQSMELNPGLNREVVKLRFRPGWLAVKVAGTKSPPTVQIEPEDKCRPAPGLLEWECDPGEFRVAVSAKGFDPQFTATRIEPGHTHTVEVRLRPARELIESYFVEASTAFVLGRLSSILPRLKEWLELDEENPDVNSFLAALAFEIDQVDRASFYSERVVRGGGKSRFNLLHNHSGFIKPHPCHVQFDGSAFMYSPAGYDCNFKDFTIPTQLIDDIGLKVSENGTYFIELNFREKPKSRTSRVMHFAHPSALIQPSSPGSTILQIRGRPSDREPLVFCRQLMRERFQSRR